MLIFFFWVISVARYLMQVPWFLIVPIPLLNAVRCWLCWACFSLVIFLYSPFCENQDSWNMRSGEWLKFTFLLPTALHCCQNSSRFFFFLRYNSCLNNGAPLTMLAFWICRYFPFLNWGSWTWLSRVVLWWMQTFCWRHLDLFVQASATMYMKNSVLLEAN